MLAVLLWFIFWSFISVKFVLYIRNSITSVYPLTLNLSMALDQCPYTPSLTYVNISNNSNIRAGILQ
jgi:hypothetical protein